MAETRARHWLVSGRVQGVGFRWWLVERARALGVRGWVRNLADGRVEAVGAGADEALARLEVELGRGPDAARVERVEAEAWSGGMPEGTFEQRPSGTAPERAGGGRGAEP